MKKQVMKYALKGGVAIGLMAAVALPALAGSQGNVFASEGGVAPLLALGAMALLYLRASMDA